MKNLVIMIVVIGYLLVGSLVIAAETYTLGFIPYVMWSHYKVAEVKGFWDKQGVSVEVINYANPLDTFQAGINKRFDFTPIPLAVVPLYRNTGVSNVTYLGTFSVADRHKNIIIKNDLVQKSLQGETIGVFLTDFANLFLLSTYLKTVNTTLDDVRIVEMNPDELEANFEHNRLSVILTMDRGNRFYEQANGVVALTTQEFYEPHGFTVFTQDFLTTIPPEDLKKILRGCVEAIEWIRDPANWEEYKAILRQHILTDQPDLSDDQIRELLREGKYVDPQTLLVHNQDLLRDYFRQFRTFLAAEGNLNADVLANFRYENVVYNQPLIEVLQEFGQ